MKKRPAKKTAHTPKRKYTKRENNDKMTGWGVTLNTNHTERRVITDAEATVKFAIFDGIIDQWHKKDEPNFAQLVRDKVFERIFEPQFRWAVEAHLQNLNKEKS